MLKMLLGSSLFIFSFVLSAQTNVEQQRLCTGLKQVFESGIQENFESINGTGAKQSPFLPVPGYSIKLPDFPIIYVDKDSRFVARKNLNLDSLEALRQLEDTKAKVAFCLDSTEWTWTEVPGDDSTTLFFREVKQYKATSAKLQLWVSVVYATPKVFSINAYVMRRRR